MMTGGGLPGDYRLDEGQFRWPSEHRVNGKRYDMEAQFSSFHMFHTNYMMYSAELVMIN